MAFCANCGTQLQDGVKFCASCGTPAGGAAPAVHAPPPAAEKVGNIRKCPACGVEVPGMTAVCPACGHEFSNVKVSQAVQDFFHKIQSETVEARKLEMIASFPIPNSREDILEFAIMASSQIQPINGAMNIGVGYLRMITLGKWKGPNVYKFNRAWKTKIKQVYTKGKIALASDKQALAQVEAMITDIKKDDTKTHITMIIILGAFVLFSAIGPVFLTGDLGKHKSAHEEKIAVETQRLETIFNETVLAIKNNDLLEAKLKANQLIWTYDSDSWDSGKTTEKQDALWDERREMLLLQIGELQDGKN
jgi:hypothetical protein